MSKQTGTRERTTERSVRKPYNGDAGYKASLKCLRPCGGHIVIYDRQNGADDIDADERWIVMHQPSTLHISVRSLAYARDLMKDAARGTDAPDADIIPMPDSPARPISGPDVFPDWRSHAERCRCRLCAPNKVTR